MAYGVLGLSPKEFGEMTVREFYAKMQGFGWLKLMAARSRAEIIVSIGNYSGNLKTGTRLRIDGVCPLPKNPPRNIFFRQLFGLPY